MAMFTAAVFLRRSVTSFVDIYSKMKENSYYASTIRQFFDYESTIESSAILQKEDRILNTYPQIREGAFEVEFENVSFSYDSNKIVLKDLNMHIHPGEKVAIIGENGVGKSTILKLILRLYDPQNGIVRINGLPIKEYHIKDLRNQIGVVMQDCDLLAFTVYDNMSLYQSCEDDELISILNQSKIGINDNRKDILNSYITKEFDSTGVVLSGGQKQKLCICRLFTKKFGLLILDEPSASLFSGGDGKTAIARMLNDRGIPNPTEYKRLHGLRYQQPMELLTLSCSYMIAAEEKSRPAVKEKI